MILTLFQCWGVFALFHQHASRYRTPSASQLRDSECEPAGFFQGRTPSFPATLSGASTTSSGGEGAGKPQARRCPPLEVCAGRRTRRLSRARRVVCQLAVRHLGYSGAAVARVLGVTTSAVNRAAWAAPLPGVTELL